MKPQRSEASIKPPHASHNVVLQHGYPTAMCTVLGLQICVLMMCIGTVFGQASCLTTRTNIGVRSILVTLPTSTYSRTTHCYIADAICLSGTESELCDLHRSIFVTVLLGLLIALFYKDKSRPSQSQPRLANSLQYPPLCMLRQRSGVYTYIYIYASAFLRERDISVPPCGMLANSKLAMSKKS